ncbi:MAG: hypothetical protein R3C05_02290 [Pirellulaceae bacterium]
MLTINMDGTATIIRAAKEFEKLGEVELGGNYQASPAYTKGYLLLRQEDQLTAIGPKPL